MLSSLKLLEKNEVCEFGLTVDRFGKLYLHTLGLLLEGSKILMQGH